MTPIVGITACNRELDGIAQHATPAQYAQALIGVAGACPVMVPPQGAAVLAVLDRLDGLLLSGSPSNVEPHHYGVSESETPGAHDPGRDATTLPLIRAAIARGIPVLAICRGVQELNVALGGSLHQRVHAVPGRDDHRHEAHLPAPEQFRLRHQITLSGQLARMLGATEITVNSLHGQAIDRPAPGCVVEAVAADGTIEAVRVVSGPGWAFGVQFHPEWLWASHGPSRALFAAFGEACRAYAAGLPRAA